MRYLDDFARWALDQILVHGSHREVVIIDAGNEEELESEFEVVRSYKRMPPGGGSQLVLEIRRKDDEYEYYNPEVASKLWAGKFRIPAKANGIVPEKRKTVKER